MTGPEAIAAAERLEKKLGRMSMAIYLATEESVAEDISGTLRETLTVLSTLRSALLQSQEALQKIAERGRHGYWLDEDGPDVIAKAVLLSPPVAPKER